MPEFTVPDLGLPDARSEDCIVLEGVAHVFGRDDLTDQVMAQATIPDPVWLIRDWDAREPIGRAEVRRDEDEIYVRAWVPADRASRLAGCPCLALAVKIVGQQGDASTMDYVAAVPAGSTSEFYRLTYVPPIPAAIPLLRDYIHGNRGTQTWRHRDDPVLLG